MRSRAVTSTLPASGKQVFVGWGFFEEGDRKKEEGSVRISRGGEGRGNWGEVVEGGEGKLEGLRESGGGHWGRGRRRDNSEDLG